MAIGSDNLEVAAQDRVIAASLPDGMKVFEDSLAASPLLLGREFFGHLDSCVEVAQFMEETALLLRTEVHGA